MPESTMRIILNDRVLLQPLTGVGHYVRQLLHAMAAEAADMEVHPFLTELLPLPWRTTRAEQAAASPPRPQPAPSPLRQRLKIALRRVLEQPYEAAFRWQARKYDLYHEPNHVPIRCDAPTVTTVHDLSVLRHPEWHPADRVRWYERAFAQGCRQTRRFIAVSEFTKREMVDLLGIPPEQIDVVLQAARPGFDPREPTAARACCQRLGLPPRFFLFVGTLEPRKNVAMLLRAYGALPPEVRRGCPLVVVGGWGWRTETLANALRTSCRPDEVRLLGYAGDNDLANLYSACTALVWPSLYEGFGLPPLEAMACGSPVIVSRATSLPEVVGDAGVLVDPEDTSAWTAAMHRFAEDHAWREHWARRGPARSALFTWRNCAHQTIACYRAAIRNAS